MLYAYDNGTEMEVVRATHITSFKREDGWWYRLDNNVWIREDFPLCNQDIITYKYKERLAKKLMSWGLNYEEIAHDLKHVTL